MMFTTEELCLLLACAHARVEQLDNEIAARESEKQILQSAMKKMRQQIDIFYNAEGRN